MNIYRKLKLWRWFRFYKFAGNHHSLKLFGISAWAFYSSNRFWWFRIFGVGLHAKDSKIYGLSFSERQGKTSYLRVSGWVISFLPYHGLKL